MGVYYRQGNLDYGGFNTHSNFSQKLDKDQISGEIMLLANAMFYKQHGTILEIIFAFLQKQVTKLFCIGAMYVLTIKPSI